MRKNPVIYEIQTLPWLHGLSEKYGGTLSLETVPEKEWEALQALGVDYVWLMGIWKRSPAAQEAALKAGWIKEAGEKIPGAFESVISGSPYAVHEYLPEPAIARDMEEVGRVRSILNRFGMRLILDFVPNHLAMDHPWTVDSPEFFIRSDPEKAAQHPEWFFAGRNEIRFAHGRDPYFPSWTDTVQVNAFNPGARAALTREMTRIAAFCDGFRCDMAMLLTNEIFGETWREYIHEPVPEDEFWPQAIQKVKEARRNTVFIAEVYWGWESRLQEMGFDYTYDKVLYDKLLSASAAEISGYLEDREESFLARSVHFIENHDEKRIANIVEPSRAHAAAAVICTIPGMRFIHDGQTEGKQIHVPIQFARGAVEKTDRETRAFYEKLLSFVNTPVLHSGKWKMIRVEGLPDDTWKNLLAWTWTDGRQRRCVIINFSEQTARGYLVQEDLGFDPEDFCDVLTGRFLYVSASKDGGKKIALALSPWEIFLLEPGPYSQCTGTFRNAQPLDQQVKR